MLSTHQINEHKIEQGIQYNNRTVRGKPVKSIRIYHDLKSDCNF